MTQKKIVRAEFPEKLRGLFKPKRYFVAYGGRGGAKSWAFARALLIMGAERELSLLAKVERLERENAELRKQLSEQALQKLSDFNQEHET